MTSDLLIIQNYPLGGAGLIEQVAHERDRTVHFVRPYEGDTVPSDLSDAWALVVLGGPQSAWEGQSAPFLEDEVELLRHCLERDTPTLAICLGAQLLARAAGARNYKGGMPEVGWYNIDLTADGKRDPLFADLAPQPKFYFSHHDTFDLPAHAVDLASTRLYPNQAFRMGKRVYGLGFHPEKTDEMIEKWLAANGEYLAQYAGVIDPSRIRRETTMLYPKRREQARLLISKFFERAEL